MEILQLLMDISFLRQIAGHTCMPTLKDANCDWKILLKQSLKLLKDVIKICL